MNYTLPEELPAVCVRSIVIRDGEILVQRPPNPRSCYAFIGGHYEPGDTLEFRLAMEFEEETNARLLSCSYLFVVENRMVVNGVLRQGIEHFFEATIDRYDVETREAHIAQHWLPIESLKHYDLRPTAVRDIIADGKIYETRHVIVPIDYHPSI